MSQYASHRGGSGEPLVLIHGIAGSWSIWRPILPALEARHDVLAVTLAGHDGGPPFPADGGPSMQAVIDQVERDLDDAGFDTAHLVGNSLGGWAALELAKRGRARSVVALSPGGGLRSSSKEERRLKWHFKRMMLALKLASPRAEMLVR